MLTSDKTIHKTTQGLSEQIELQTGMTNNLVFKVKACSDLNISLIGKRNLNNHKYEFIVGGQGDSLTVLMKMDKQVAETTRSIGLSCTETKTLWISWIESKVRLGKGSTIGEALFLEYLDYLDHPFISQIQTITLQSETKAVWDISWDYVDGVTVTTPSSTLGSAPWFTTISDKYFIFNVRACKDATVTLAETFGVDSDRSYQVF